MELKSVKIDKNFKDLPKIVKMYNEAFPENEQLATIENILAHPSSETVAYYDDTNMVGFTVLLKHDIFYYLWFFAVNKNMRGKGYGSEILKKLSLDYNDKRIIFDIESPDDTAENALQRVKRKHFYEKNGFVDIGIEFSLPNLSPHLMMSNKQVDNKKEFMKKTACIAKDIVSMSGNIIKSPEDDMSIDEIIDKYIRITD